MQPLGTKKLPLEYAALFIEPTHLPPQRHCDHRIPLKNGAGLVVVRPYRYPHGQKDEIEQQCSTMLHQGIIRPSQSSFSSPILLVPKADVLGDSVLITKNSMLRPSKINSQFQLSMSY